METYVLEEQALKQLQQELNDLERKKNENARDVKLRLQAKLDEIENSTTWQNRLKSARSGWKEYNPGSCSAGGPPPICVVEHWYRVSVAEAMAEFNALLEKELDKIRKDANIYDESVDKKRNELYNLKNTDNEYHQERQQLKAEMDKKLDENNNIRQRIVELSKLYENQVEREIKAVQNTYIKPMMNEVANKNHGEIMVGIFDAKVAELDAEEKKAVADLNVKLTKEHDEKLKNINLKMNLAAKKLQIKDGETKEELRELNLKLGTYRFALKGVVDSLNLISLLTDSEASKLQYQKLDLERLIQSLENEIKKVSTTLSTYKDLKEAEIKRLNNEIWVLKQQLPRLILEGEKNLKQAFQTKREILFDRLNAHKTKLALIDNAIGTKENEFRSKINIYEQSARQERSRLMSACQSSGASCFGTNMISKIWQNANNLISCARQQLLSGPIYTNISCTEALSYYASVYNSLINGISDADLGVLRRNNSSMQYERLLKKL
ncbi:MAG TPA: hypothetical protein PKA53_07925 [Sphingobacterium sp.]|nr:hypothetical protein [Sphingobacterium sp.]